LASLAEVVDTKELQEYSTADIEKLQLDKINGLWSTYSDAITEANKSQNLTDPEGQLDAVAQGYDISDINEAVSDAALYASLGLPTGNLTTFDSNGDGKFDSTDVATLYKGVSTTKPTLDSVANGTYRPPAKLTLQAPKISAAQTLIADAARDGTISDNEVTGVSTDELYDLNKTLLGFEGQKRTDASSKISSLLEIISKRTTEELAPVLSNYQTVMSSVESGNNIQNMWKIRDSIDVELAKIEQAIPRASKAAKIELDIRKQRLLDKKQFVSKQIDNVSSYGGFKITTTPG
jgi:hypothetical protein